METQNLSIGVIGAGYVGLVAGACFSSLGFESSLVEIDKKKLESLGQGKVPFFEPGLSTHLETGLAKKRLHFYPSTKDMFAQRQPGVVFIAVGTPSNPDGSCNLDYVFQAVKDVVGAVEHDVVLVLKSTVPVGTAKKVKELIGELKPAFKVAVVNNPEFLKEGAAVNDFMRPERIVIGGTDEWALERVRALYESLVINGHPLFVTDHESAELAKLAANLVLASRISIINQIARLADAVGANIKDIESIAKSDSRIGSKYLYASLGYGGSCFPKDVKNFVTECKRLGVDASMAETVDSFNDSQKLYFIEDIKKNFPPESGPHKIALLGIAFKAETDDIREAPSLVITKELSRLGYKLSAYDPQALGTFSQWLDNEKISGVELCDRVEAALEGASAMIVLSEWQEFHRLVPERLKRIFSGKKIYDGKNLLPKYSNPEHGYDYMGIGLRAVSAKS